MTNETNQSDTALWRRAIEICEALTELDHDQVLAKLKAMQLEPLLLEKVQRILSNMSASNPLLDQQNYADLIDSLKQGNHLIGQTIDGYKIMQLIGKGGMSTVYEAVHENDSSQQAVAIKFLSPYGITEKAIELFNREQYILSKLSHPSIVAFHHSGITADGKHYLVMELLPDAENILDYCTSKVFGERKIVALVKEICAVFAYAHQQKVIHRDIKPANILVNPEGKVKVIDFGIGRLDVADGKTVTKVFTPDMAAPEQLLGLGINAQADVFSLGALFLHLLTKKKPLPKTNIKSYNPAHDAKHIKDLLQGSEISLDLKKIINKAMHIDASMRYASMQEFAEDLDNWLNRRPVNAASDSFLYKAKGFYAKNRSISALVFAVVFIGLGATWFITHLEGQKQKVTAQRNSSFALLEAMIDQANPATNENVVDGDLLTKNLSELATKQAPLLASDSELAYFFYNKLSELYNSKGLYNEALENNRVAFKYLEQLTDSDDNRYISNQLTQGHLLESTGQHQAAQELAESLLLELEQQPKTDPKHLINNYYLLCKLYQYQAANETALVYGQKALDLINQHPAVRPALQASIFNSVAVVNRNLGNTEAVEPLYLKAVEILRPSREKHKDLSSILVNLAIFKGRSGDMEASEQYFNESFEVIKAIDPSHPHLAMNYLPYTTLLNLTGRADESVSYLKEAIEIFKANKQSKHLAQAYLKYARIGLYQFDPNITLTNLIAAYPMALAIYGQDHPQLYDIYNMAMWVLMAPDLLPEALGLIEKVDDIAVEKVTSHPEYKRYQVQKALVLRLPQETDFPEAIISRFRNQISKLSASEQLSWLDAQNSMHGDYSAIISSWLLTQTAVLNKDTETIIAQCTTTQKWISNSQLAHKMILIDLCLQQQHLLAAETIGGLSQLVEKTQQNPAELKSLAGEFLQLVGKRSQ